MLLRFLIVFDAKQMSALQLLICFCACLFVAMQGCLEVQVL